jgi:hypothetical protein
MSEDSTLNPADELPPKVDAAAPEIVKPSDEKKDNPGKARKSPAPKKGGLDFGKPYGQLFGPHVGAARYTQDGKYFDVNGKVVAAPK